MKLKLTRILNVLINTKYATADLGTVITTRVKISKKKQNQLSTIFVKGENYEFKFFNSVNSNDNQI